MHGKARAAIGTAAFLVLATGVEAGLAPWVLTGWNRGDGVLDVPAVRVAGVAILAAGLALVAWTLVRFVAEGVGTPSPLAPPRRLVVGGPYRFVRHPMYAGTAAAIAGQGLLLARPILLAGAALYVAAFAVYVRVAEEPQLAHRFGRAWDGYRRAVPAWRPRLRPGRGRRDEGPGPPRGG